MVTEDGKVIEGFERGVLFSFLSTDKKVFPSYRKISLKTDIVTQWIAKYQKKRV